MNDETSQSDALGEVINSFVDRYRRGERPSVEEYAQAHPELADAIRDLLPSAVALEEVKSAGSDASDAWSQQQTETVVEQLKGLDDYRIVRELGRGGMGIVYEAEQISLGRRVALKVLPAAATLDPRHLERFRREARAAAQLHHTNIVPVFGSGQSGGLHFFVMQYIPGHGLEAVIRELARLRHAGADAETRCRHDSLTATDVARWLLSGIEARSASEGIEARSASEGIEARSASEGIEARSASEGIEARSASEGIEARSASTNGSSLSRALTAGEGPGEGRVRGPNPGPGPHAQHSRHYWRSVAQIGVQVAEALQYAHLQGMVHRDIKPSNLLLDIHGNIWVTDFGLAKHEGDGSLTREGDLLGTLRYMAPEALGGRADHRSDLYSLGLSLYELISLTPARHGLHRGELVSQVQQGTVPRLGKLNPQTPRDLETIIHKAISPEPARRYQTAAELAEDLQRFLRDEPIRARHVTVWERAARWCRRNPAISATTAAAAAVILVTVAVAFALIAGAKQRAEMLAEAQGQLAEKNAGLAEREKSLREQLQVALSGEAEQRRLAEGHMRETETARDRQQRAAKEAKAVSDFLVLDMLGAANPQRNHGRQLTVREMLDRAAERVGGSFQGDPETEAAVRVAVGRAYYSLGLYGQSQQQLTSALQLQRRELGTEHLSTLKTEINLAATLYGQGKYGESRALQQQTLAALRRHAGPDQPEALETLGNLAVNLHGQGQYPQAEKLLDEVLQHKRRVLGPEDESTLATLSNLAVNLTTQGKLAEGEMLHREAWDIKRRKYGEHSPSTLITVNNLAVNLGEQHRYPDAEKLLQEALAASRRTLGPEHPDTLAAINNLAVNLDSQGKLAEAQALEEELCAAFRRSLGEEHPSTITATNNLAMNLVAQGKQPQAELMQAKAVLNASRALGPEHPTTLHVSENLAKCLIEQKKFAEAESLLRTVLAVRRRTAGEDHEKTLATKVRLATVLAQLGKAAEARSLEKEAHEGQRRRLGEERPADQRPATK